jgi:hypothetical protein
MPSMTSISVSLRAILAPLGYRWYRIDGPGPLMPRPAIEGDPAYEHLNWLFAPVEPALALWERLPSGVSRMRPSGRAVRLSPLDEVSRISTLAGDAVLGITGRMS